MTTPKQDRLNIDMKGLRVKIENFRLDPAWQALSLSKKIRVLIEIGLSQSGDQTLKEPYQSLGDLIADNWKALHQSSITTERLTELRNGSKPTAAEQVRIGAILEDVELVISLVEKQEENPKKKASNGI